MGHQGTGFSLPSYEEIPRSEQSQMLQRVLEVCQSQQERIVFLEETVVQLKNEIAILKGEKPRPKIKAEHDGAAPADCHGRRSGREPRPAWSIPGVSDPQ